MDAAEHSLVVEIACPGLATSRHALIVRDAAGVELAGHASFGEWTPTADVPTACRRPRCDELVPPVLEGAPLPSGAASRTLGALATCFADAKWTASVDEAALRLDATVLAWLPVHTPARPARTAALVERAAATRDPTLLATLGVVVGASARAGVPFVVGRQNWYLGPACGCDGGAGSGEPTERAEASGGVVRGPLTPAARVGDTVLLHGDRTMQGGAYLIPLGAPPALVICTCNGEVQWTR